MACSIHFICRDVDNTYIVLNNITANIRFFERIVRQKNVGNYVNITLVLDLTIKNGKRNLYKYVYILFGQGSPVSSNLFKMHRTAVRPLILIDYLSKIFYFFVNFLLKKFLHVRLPIKEIVAR